MFAHEFVRNAFLAGSFVALACGLIGYFVVLRAQVFAGDALSHVAFTGALAAAAAGIDVRVGLFAGTVLIGLVIGGLGERAHADDVTIGIIFAWILGLGVYFLALFSAGSGGGNGVFGTRALFGSIFGLSAADARLAALIAGAVGRARAPCRLDRAHNQLLGCGPAPELGDHRGCRRPLRARVRTHHQSP